MRVFGYELQARPKVNNIELKASGVSYCNKLIA